MATPLEQSLVILWVMLLPTGLAIMDRTATRGTEASAVEFESRGLADKNEITFHGEQF